LNEKEDTLLLPLDNNEKNDSCNNNNNNRDAKMNTFDLYTKTDLDLIDDDETELQCEWPEPLAGRKLLVEFVQFKLSLNLPVSSIFSSSSSSTAMISNAEQSSNASLSAKLTRPVTACHNRNEAYVNVTKKNK
jgi:hypothetical protein